MDGTAEARRAVPADDLAFAGVSGRRVLLFQRHRMGGGGRRHQRCRIACAAGWRRCCRTARAFATACFWRTRIARRRAATTRGCARSPSSPRPSCPRASASWRPPRRAAPSSISRARPGLATGWIRSSRPATAPIAYPVAVGLVGAGHGIRLDPTLHAFLHAQTVELDFRRRPADPARADRQPARAGAARAGRGRHRQARAARPRSTISAAPRFAPISPACGTRRSIRDCSGHEHRRPATRYAIANETAMASRSRLAGRRQSNSTCTRTARFASASAARSAPARPR